MAIFYTQLRRIVTTDGLLLNWNNSKTPFGEKSVFEYIINENVEINENSRMESTNILRIYYQRRRHNSTWRCSILNGCSYRLNKNETIKSYVFWYYFLMFYTDSIIWILWRVLIHKLHFSYSKSCVKTQEPFFWFTRLWMRVFWCTFKIKIQNMLNENEYYIEHLIVGNRQSVVTIVDLLVFCLYFSVSLNGKINFNLIYSAFLGSACPE